MRRDGRNPPVLGGINSAVLGGINSPGFSPPWTAELQLAKDRRASAGPENARPIRAGPPYKWPVRANLVRWFELTSMRLDADRVGLGAGGMRPTYLKRSIGSFFPNRPSFATYQAPSAIRSKRKPNWAKWVSSLLMPEMKTP